MANTFLVYNLSNPGEHSIVSAGSPLEINGNKFNIVPLDLPMLMGGSMSNNMSHTMSHEEEGNHHRYSRDHSEDRENGDENYPPDSSDLSSNSFSETPEELYSRNNGINHSAGSIMNRYKSSESTVTAGLDNFSTVEPIFTENLAKLLLAARNN